MSNQLHQTLSRLNPNLTQNNLIQKLTLQLVLKHLNSKRPNNKIQTQVHNKRLQQTRKIALILKHIRKENIDNNFHKILKHLLIHVIIQLLSDLRLLNLLNNEIEKLLSDLILANNRFMNPLHQDNKTNESVPVLIGAQVHKVPVPDQDVKNDTFSPKRKIEKDIIKRSDLKILLFLVGLQNVLTDLHVRKTGGQVVRIGVTHQLVDHEKLLLSVY